MSAATRASENVGPCSTRYSPGPGARNRHQHILHLTPPSACVISIGHALPVRRHEVVQKKADDGDDQRPGERRDESIDAKAQPQGPGNPARQQWMRAGVPGHGATTGCYYLLVLTCGVTPTYGNGWAWPGVPPRGCRDDAVPPRRGASPVQRLAWARGFLSAGSSL